MDLFKKLFKMTCKDTSPLISEMMDHSLPFFKRLRVRLHLAMCGLCQYYQGQLNVLRNVAQSLNAADLQSEEQPVLSQEAKQKIKQSIGNYR